jgi:hypothetical protein
VNDAGLRAAVEDGYRARDDSLAALARHAGLAADVPPDFLQHREPRIRADDPTPVEWPADPALEWCPPGQGGGPRLAAWWAAEGSACARSTTCSTRATASRGVVSAP